ncbi:MAG: hypothetical protein M1510_08100 [Nitrospirae bacterium]|nr:hypothetical protein [Nitrospirota bacterium]MCL5238412.1 hypothetical protein [Nitrospirota bacterium]
MQRRFEHLTRRSFLGLTAKALAVASLFPKSILGGRAYAADDIKRPGNPEKMTDMEKMHVPEVDLPLIAEDGRFVPVKVTVNHPMTPDHYIKSIEIIDNVSPIKSKGKFNLTYRNGEAYIMTRIKLAESATVTAIAECNVHGKWAGENVVKVTLGGC